MVFTPISAIFFMFICLFVCFSLFVDSRKVMITAEKSNETEISDCVTQENIETRCESEM